MHLGFLDCPIGGWAQNYGAWRNPELTGALFRLLLSSWQQSPCATLPDDDQILADLAVLPLTHFQAVKSELMSGFIKDGIRWKSPELADRAEALVAHHRESLSLMQASVVATTLAPDTFSLQLSEAERNDRKRRRKLPPGFGVSHEMLAWATAYFERAIAEQGGKGDLSKDKVQAVMLSILETFRADATSKGWLYEDWDSAFQLYTRRQTNGDFGLCSRYFPELFPVVVTPAVPLVRPGGFGPSNRRGAMERRAEVLDSADSALAEILGRKDDDNVIDLDAPVVMRGA